MMFRMVSRTQIHPIDISTYKTLKLVNINFNIKEILSLLTTSYVSIGAGLIKCNTLANG